jgi:hypothetical protein
MSAIAHSSIELELLHDALLLGVNLSIANSLERIVTLTFKAPDDANGKPQLIFARHVYLFRYTAWGHTSAPESLDAWREGVSPATSAELERDRAAGLTVPPQMYQVTFHRGSSFELVCERLEFASIPLSGR